MNDREETLVYAGQMLTLAGIMGDRELEVICEELIDALDRDDIETALAINEVAKEHAANMQDILMVIKGKPDDEIPTE